MPDLDPDLPVCNFSGVTKQLQTDQFNEDQLALLDLCFPEFLDSDIRNGPLEHLGLRQPETAQPRPPDWGRLRRFAGSQDLSRGRYHTLCFGTEGNDGGTLLRELYAYWNESTNVLPIVKDTTLAAPATVDDIAHRSKRPLLKLEIEQHRKKRRLIRKPILESRSLAKISLPLAIEKIEIKNVIDLRLIEVQEWFYEQFTRLEHDIGMRGHTDTESGNTFRTVKFHKPRDFVDLIPTLVMPGIGGSSFHQAVGGWLRSHAVHALIYPSARCDAYIKKIHNTANGYKDYEFYGWNCR